MPFAHSHSPCTMRVVSTMGPCDRGLDAKLLKLGGARSSLYSSRELP